MIEITGRYGHAKIMIDDVEATTMGQITQMCNHPAFNNDIVIMPDCHAGMGSVIGFTMPFHDKIIPNTVGVDIGCGMLSLDTGLIELEHSLEELDRLIRWNVPTGFKIRDKKHYDLCHGEFPELEEMCEKIGMDPTYAWNSLGTLGGGNHFIEIGKSVNTGHIWMVIHSGSRNLGLKVCKYHQNCAKHILKEWRTTEWNQIVKQIRDTSPPDQINNKIKEAKRQHGYDQGTNFKNMEYLKDEAARKYYTDMDFAQCYASMNRSLIAQDICNILNVGHHTCRQIQSIHNYVEIRGRMIIRKGAISAYDGDEIVIPLNPTDGTLICKGKGNAKWNYSAPHGAGRIMGRREAKRRFSQEEVDKTMDGIYSSLIPLDENKLVYKDSAMIEAALEPTAEIIDRIKPILNIKAGN